MKKLTHTRLANYLIKKVNFPDYIVFLRTEHDKKYLKYRYRMWISDHVKTDFSLRFTINKDILDSFYVVIHKDFYIKWKHKKVPNEHIMVYDKFINIRKELMYLFVNLFIKELEDDRFN